LFGPTDFFIAAGGFDDACVTATVGGNEIAVVTLLGSTQNLVATDGDVTYAAGCRANIAGFNRTARTTAITAYGVPVVTFLTARDVSVAATNGTADGTFTGPPGVENALGASVACGGVLVVALFDTL
jgi:hypothetical protein